MSPLRSAASEALAGAGEAGGCRSRFESDLPACSRMGDDPLLLTPEPCGVDGFALEAEIKLAPRTGEDSLDVDLDASGLTADEAESASLPDILRGRADA